MREYTGILCITYLLSADLTSQADKPPAPAPGYDQSRTCRVNVTGEEMWFNLQSMFGFKAPVPTFGLPGWSSTAEALKQAARGMQRL